MMHDADSRLVASSADWAFRFVALADEGQAAVVTALIRAVRRGGRLDRVASLLSPAERKAFVAQRVLTLVETGRVRQAARWTEPAEGDREEVVSALVGWVLAKPATLLSEALRFRTGLDGGVPKATSLDEGDKGEAYREFQAEAASAGSGSEWLIPADRRAIARVDLERAIAGVARELSARRSSPARELAVRLLALLQGDLATQDEMIADALVSRARRTAPGSEAEFRISDHAFDKLLGSGWRDRPKDLARRHAALGMVAEAAQRVLSRGNLEADAAGLAETYEVEQAA